MPTMRHQLTATYVTLADFFATHPQTANGRQSNHSQPAFTDAEVLTIALMQNYFQTPSLKRAYWLLRANDPSAFRHLPAYQQWLARLHKLSAQLGQLLVSSTPSDTWESDYYWLDAKPIPMCLPIRHGRLRLLRDDGACFGKRAKGWFFGFKLHLVRDPDGRLLYEACA